jgi:transmembrane sensor
VTSAAHREEQARLEAAAGWMTRLESGDLDDALAFDAWLSASPANQAAFDRVALVWTEFDGASAQVLAGLAARRSRRARGLPGAWMAAAGGMAAAAAVGAIFVMQPLPGGPRTETYAAKPAEQRVVRLPDGTQMALNGATNLRVSLGRSERRVTLDAGEAMFDVAADHARPFVIQAGDRTVTVVGTKFDVRRRGGHLTVAVLRGQVRVGPSDGSTPGVSLTPGQRLDHAEGRSDARLSRDDAGDAGSWRTGTLVYRDAPLGEVVEDLNAQFARPIKLADQHLANTRISGVFVLDNQDAVIRRLRLLAPFRAVASDASVTLEDVRR